MKQDGKKIIYFTNYAAGEKEMHDLEFRTLFNECPFNRILISEIDLEVNRSIFVKEKLYVYCDSNDFDGLLIQVKNLNLDFENIRVDYIKHEKLSVAYEERLVQMGKIGAAILGDSNLHHPDHFLAITEIDGIFYFGVREKGGHGCDKRQNKPYSYSVSCSTRVARVLSNLALKHDYSLSVIDPCCGIATVVLELLTMGAKNIAANELHEKVAKNAIRNLNHYGYNIDLSVGDIQDIKSVYDVAILDIPYGHYIKTEEQNQKNILMHCSTIADEIILLSQTTMDKQLIELGYKIVDQCSVDKFTFRRHITIAKKIAH